MNCVYVNKHLADYIEGELPPVESQAVEAHIDGCAACQKELAGLIACRDKLQQALQLAARKVAPPASALTAIEEKAGILRYKTATIATEPSHVLAGVALSFLTLILTLGSFLPFLGAAMLPPPDAPAIAGDGSGGVYIYWSTGDREFEQHIDAAGNALWGEGGREITGGTPGFNTGEAEDEPQIKPWGTGGRTASLSDGSGNTIRLWYEDNENNIYAEKVGNDGVILWKIKVYDRPAFDTIGSSTFVSDGAGGVIIVSRAGEDDSISNTHSVYAQRINAEGERLWGESGIEVQKVPSSPAVLIIAGVSLLIVALVVAGLYRGSKGAKVLTPIISLTSFFTGMYCLMLLNFNFGQNAFQWDYILNTLPHEAAIFAIFAAGLALAVLGITKAKISKWIMVPVLVPYALITALFIMLAVYALF